MTLFFPTSRISVLHAGGIQDTPVSLLVHDVPVEAALNTTGASDEFPCGPLVAAALRTDVTTTAAPTAAPSTSTAAMRSRTHRRRRDPPVTKTPSPSAVSSVVGVSSSTDSMEKGLIWQARATHG